ncbi:hypothetical protein HDU76_006625 [Blyttiomyces sp. JEL0837]|nr:hypothetical protein HDU76_006625 [Blyttiomyces sp. JEL0837]
MRNNNNIISYEANIISPQPLQHWEGFGTSLSWWSNVPSFAQDPDIADLLFTASENVSLTKAIRPASVNPGKFPGLGFQIVRYNIGASSNGVLENGSKMVIPFSNTFPTYKQIPGFWVIGQSMGSTSRLPDITDNHTWNWNSDINQRTMLKMAKSRGVLHTEAFSNSPMWWMTKDLSASGTRDGSRCLQQQHRDSFAYYLASVTSYFHTNFNITFDYLEPFNEPSAPWWRFDDLENGLPGTQEGCIFDSDDMNVVVDSLRGYLNSMGLGNTIGITVHDENSVDDAMNSLNKVLGTRDQTVLLGLDKVNVHGYSGINPYRGLNRPKLRQQLGKLNNFQKSRMKLWMSEYCDSDQNGAVMAKSIVYDITQLNPSAWIYWQALDVPGWGLVAADLEHGLMQQPTYSTKYFVMAHFSRHLRNGMYLLESDDSDHSIVAWDPVDKVLVLVVVWSDEGGDGVEGMVTWNLINLGMANGGVLVGNVTIDRWVTNIGGGSDGELYTHYRNDVVLNKTSLVFTAPLMQPETIHTFEIRGLDFVMPAFNGDPGIHSDSGLMCGLVGVAMSEQLNMKCLLLWAELATVMIVPVAVIGAWLWWRGRRRFRSNAVAKDYEVVERPQ